MIIRIRDLDGYVLAVHLFQIMELIGDQALHAKWRVSPVKLENGEEWFEVLGTSGPYLEQLANDDATIDGTELFAVSKSAKQIIWGEFSAFRDFDLIDPFLVIKAVDSSYYEISTEEVSIFSKIRQKYKHTEY